VIRGISAAISQPFSQVLAALAVAMRTLKPGVAYRVLQLSARSLVVGLGILVSASGTAAGDSKAVVSTQHVTATLVAEVAAVVPGATHWLGLQLRLAPQWHVYWRNPGDSGYPPSFTWTLPAGARAGEIEWPLPTRIAVGPLTNFGYKGEVLLAVPIEIPEDYAARSFPVRLAAEWLVCKEDCIPESGTFALELPVVGALAQAEPGQRGLFAAARQAVPMPSPPAGWSVSARVESGQVSVRIVTPATAPPLDSLTFFPFAEGQMQPSAEQRVRRQSEGYVLTLTGAEVPIGDWTSLAGILVASPGAGAGTGPIAFAVDEAIAGAAPGAIHPASPAAPDATAPGAASEGRGALSFAAVAGLAFVGGILLNLMPCVFPILSIKLLGLVRHAGEAAEGRRQRRRHALFYTLGVVGTFLSLAGLLLALKATGTFLGWGFQLQSPPFVGAMALLFFALGLSLSGALPIATLAQDVPGIWRQRHPKVDALAAGALAVLVASPCTAPFMGVALGAAFAMPAALTLAVFLALALGMALPYALLASMPRALAGLPTPGAWMVRLKEFLAFPLYATVVWLAWVLVEQVGPTAILYLGAGLLLVALLAWLLHLQHPFWRTGGGIAALTSALALMLVMPAVTVPARSAAPGGPPSVWEPWSPAALSTAREANAGVFVDFTAAWCVTCQINKRLVLSRDVVLADFAKAGVQLMRADWTRHDPEITRALAALGRSGVPVYALYPPRGEPILLPEVLTHTSILAALARLPDAGQHASRTSLSTDERK
jgi:thiol:disulfide interchange protein/DsbC/DsbD-like thiol-disulfide interchange protein